MKMCNDCQKDKEKVIDEAVAIKKTAEMTQKYDVLSKAVIVLVIGFIIMAGCMVWAVTNAQRLANEAVLNALNAMAEMEFVSETMHIEQDTGEGEGNNVFQSGEYATYEEAVE